MKSKLTLDEHHRYFLGDRQFPGATEMLSALGLTDYSAPWFTEEGRVRGGYLHRCCELINHGDLDFDSVDKSMRGEVEAYLTWLALTGFKPVAVEKIMYSLVYGFAGKPDMVGVFSDGTYAVIDIKRGLGAMAVRYQLALYAILAAIDSDIPVKSPYLFQRFSLEGFSGGKSPKMLHQDDRRDIETAKAIAHVFNAGLAAGIYKLRGEM